MTTDKYLIEECNKCYESTKPMLIFSKDMNKVLTDE